MPTRDAWLRAVRGVVLKSNPDGDDAAFAEAFTRQLVSETEDGVEIQPLYDSSEPIDVGLPGFAPYVRSTHAAPSPWEIRQRAWPAVDGSSARGELEGGATGVLVELPADADAALVAEALDGVFLDLAPVSLSTPADDVGLTAARALADRWDAAGIAADERHGTLGVDPVGTWMRTGGTTDLDSALADAAALVGELTESAPHARVVVADGTVWHDAGATDAQEIAWNVAAAAHTVRALVAAGVPLDRASRQLEFRWAATADQFETIATFRAARRVWARVGEIAGLPPADRTSFHHADCSRVMMTRYDPWVNALRSTVACFAAGMGGADAVTVLPHDALVTANQVDGAARRSVGGSPATPRPSCSWRATWPASSTRPAARGTSSTSPTNWRPRRGANCSASRPRVASSPRSRPASCTRRSTRPAPPASDASPPAASHSPA